MASHLQGTVNYNKNIYDGNPLKIDFAWVPRI